MFSELTPAFFSLENKPEYNIMTLDHEDIQAIADALAARLAPVLGVAALPTIPPPRTDDYQRRRADALHRLLGPKKSRGAAA